MGCHISHILCTFCMVVRFKYMGISEHSVVFVLNVPPTAKVIWRRGHGLKSHPTDW